MLFTDYAPGIEYSTVTGSILGRDVVSPRLHYGLFTAANRHPSGRRQRVH
jgi:hypothetical protein